jgi:hypothetical protein
MNFIKVWTELDDGKFKSLPARIVRTTNKNTYTIQYLSPTTKRTSSGKRVYAYEDEVYEITDESIVQKADSELSLGFEEMSSSKGNFVKFDIRCEVYEDEEDEDYVPSSSEEDGSSSDTDSCTSCSDEEELFSDEEDEDEVEEEEEEFSEYEE